MAEPTPVRQALQEMPFFQEVVARSTRESEAATIADRHATPDGHPICMKCKRIPDEITALVDMAKMEGMPAEEYAKEDGTYDDEFNMFVCDACYIAIGMPLRDDLKDMMQNAYTL